MNIEAVHGRRALYRERSRPGDACWTAEHAEIMARYLFAGQFAAGRCVLDAATGTGYGAAALSACGASAVHGIDNDADAVRDATARFSAPTVSFAVDDCACLRTVQTPVDLVCSFETIEHIEEPRRFIEAVARVLAPGGAFICSTPDRAMMPPFVDGRPYDPHDRFEWYRAEFLGMLAEFFTTVELRIQVATFGYAMRSRAVSALQRGWPLRLGRRLPAWIGLRYLWTAVDRLAIPAVEDFPLVAEPRAPLLGETVSIVAIRRGALA
jgi:SAM-dependent methyltransferase